MATTTDALAVVLLDQLDTPTAQERDDLTERLSAAVMQRLGDLIDTAPVERVAAIAERFGDNPATRRRLVQHLAYLGDVRARALMVRYAQEDEDAALASLG